MSEPSTESPKPALPPKDTRVHDIDKARAMAEAGHPLRSEVARTRKIMGIFNKHETEIKNLWEEAASRGGIWNPEKVKQLKGYKELAQKLSEEMKAVGKIYKGGWRSFGVFDEDNVEEFLFLSPGSLDQNAEMDSAKADRREHWAGVLHDHPVEGLQIGDVLRIEKELEEAKRKKNDLQDGINTLDGKYKPEGGGWHSLTIYFPDDYVRADLEEDTKNGVELTDNAREERKKQFDEDSIGALVKTAGKVEARVKNMENTLQQIETGTYKIPDKVAA